MANVVYPLLIFIFVFGAATTFLNTSGLYQHHLPNSGLASGTDQASDLNTGIQSAAGDPNTFNTNSIFMLGQVVGGGILAVLTLGPLLISYGVPPSMAVFLISPLGLVLVAWVVELLLARYLE